MDRPQVGLIGYGYWGPNLARNFSTNKRCALKRIVEIDPARRNKAAQSHPGVEVTADAADVLGAADIDVVVIATPVSSHFPLAQEALGGAGEGGAVLTSDDALAARVRMLRDHGQTSRYHHGVVGFNYRMDGIQGAVLGVKAKRVEEWTERRRAVASFYRKELEGLDGLTLPAPEGHARHVYHLFVVRSPRRDALQAALAARGVGCGLHYPMPLHLQEAYAGLGYSAGDLPRAEAWAGQCLSLPIFPEMSGEEMAWVVEQCREAVRECGR